MKNRWPGIMTILYVQHWRDGVLLSEKTNIHNVLHSGGEQFVLQVVFGGVAVPAAYYLGLDNRQTVSVSDTLSSLVLEPQTNGYTRQPLMPVTNFTITQSGGTYVASTSVVTFMASGGSWGPVQNLFLATTLDNSGVLISTASTPPAFTVDAGDQILMRLSMSLGNPS